MLLTTEKVRRDLKSCAKQINRALRDLEEAMDELTLTRYPEDFTGKRDWETKDRACSKSWIHILRGEICRLIERLAGAAQPGGSRCPPKSIEENVDMIHVIRVTQVP